MDQMRQESITYVALKSLKMYIKMSVKEIPGGTQVQQGRKEKKKVKCTM